jgi:hypothetical protein
MTSSAELENYLCACESCEVHALIELMRSRLSPESEKLAKEHLSLDSIPSPRSEDRQKVCGRIVALLGWYGSNAVAYVWRKTFQVQAGKPYLGILRDVVRGLNRRLPRKQRQVLPLAASVSDFEQKVVEILLRLRFHKKSPEEIVQILQESGLEEDIAKEVAGRYGPGLASVGLPILTAILGKKTVMVMVQQLLVAIVGRYIGKEAASLMAKRIAVKIAQKTLTRLITWVGWALLALDIAMFAAAPARRITLKAVPFMISRDRDDDYALPASWGMDSGKAHLQDFADFDSAS